jgi:hypothetical protein
MRPGDYIPRAAYAHAVSALDPRQPGGPEKVLRDRWSDDAVTPLVLKAAVDPAMMSVSGWAGIVASQAAGDYVSTLSRTSAAAAVFAKAFRADLDGIASILLPRRVTPPAAADVNWVAPGDPIPAGQISLSGATLGPAKKLAVMVALTRTLMESSAAENVLTTMLRESVSFSLDATVFSTLAATTARPAGILNGIAGLTATAGGGTTAMEGDLEKLAAAVSDAVGDVVIVAHPRQAFAIRIRAPQFGIPVFATRAIAAGTIVMLDPQALAVSFGTDPRFEAGIEGVLHLDDATPLAIETAGTPPTVAAAVRSAWQTDCVVTRCILPAAWVLRQTGTVAWLSSATWG